MVEFEVLSWNDIHKLTLVLAKKIVESGYMPDVIIGIMRGGWIPARILLDYLNIPTLATIEIKFYKGIGETRERPIIIHPLVVDIRNKKVLIVDDVVDTGKSMSIAIEMAKLGGAYSIKTAALVVKPWSILEPDYYAMKSDKWIVFPWEIRETIENILELEKEKITRDNIEYLSRKYSTLLRADVEDIKLALNLIMKCRGGKP
ncbi:MAG TPA: phosphoribosyltransferase [Desulfurococcales archaeon]|nr:phosphoribosyltransferase [Desulfurococcales archaeon]